MTIGKENRSRKNVRNHTRTLGTWHRCNSHAHTFVVLSDCRIANFFHQIRLADELNFGVCNLYHYGKIHSDAKPIFGEDDAFRLFMPLNDYSDREVDKASAEPTPETTLQTAQETLHHKVPTKKERWFFTPPQMENRYELQSS